jgi:hypothetical protein
LVGLLILFLLLLWALLSRRGDDTPPTGEGDAPAADCPAATPEFFTVEPVTSPTDQLSQVITVDLGNGETITVTGESGVFSAPFDAFPKEIEITLLPDTTHNLTVEGKVKEITQGECVYGGYVLSTTTDRNGDPLVIEQREP